MRLILVLFAAAFGVSLAMTIPGIAQQQQQQQQPLPQQQLRDRTTAFNERPSPIHRSFNSCVDLAMQRGWAESDLYDDRQGVRDFIMNCMQGRQQ
jgi:predicted PurR-regulated permease PerM